MENNAGLLKIISESREKQRDPFKHNKLIRLNRTQGNNINAKK